jgi:hypothetical protein
VRDLTAAAENHDVQELKKAVQAVCEQQKALGELMFNERALLPPHVFQTGHDMVSSLNKLHFLARKVSKGHAARTQHQTYPKEWQDQVTTEAGKIERLYQEAVLSVHAWLAVESAPVEPAR